MGQVLVTESNLQNIADAIREKTGSSDTYTPAEMSEAISDISTGTIVLKPGVLLPAFESVKKWSYDKYLHEDEEITIPAYTTTSTTLIASAASTTTYTCDFDTYHYLVSIRMLTIPEYSVTTVGKGRQEYGLNGAIYEITNTPANTMSAIFDPTLKITSDTRATFSAGNFVGIVYYSNGTTLARYASAAYGYNQTVTAPAVSGSTLTLKSPTFITRGHTTYFTSTYMNKVTDVRYQYIQAVFRIKKNEYNLSGWSLMTQWQKMLTDTLSNSHTLT